MQLSSTGLFARLKSGGSAIALCAIASMGLAGRASAQPADAGVESVTVSGFKASLERSLEQKRNATNAVDSILAEDIAKFPDTNLSESIQRIPGVALNRSNGEGKQIAVRGLSPLWRPPVLLLSSVARQAFKLRAEKVERSFAVILDIGGLRRTWLRGVENVEKRYLIQVAAYNLGLVIRHRFGAGTPRQASEAIWFVFPKYGPDRPAIRAILLVGIRENIPAAGDGTAVAALLLAFST